MTIRIVTDSTCDLPPEVIQDLRIEVIPILIHVGATTYQDGIDLSREAFYEQLPALKPSPVTAAPGVEAFYRVYERLRSQGSTQILSIHISHKLSAIMNVARQAADEMRGVTVTPFDSQQLSLGTGFLVQAAAQLARQGRSMAEILSALEAQVRRTQVFAALDTLEYMRRGGRMNGTITALGNLLQIKPILKMYNGEPTAERVRTRAAALRRIRELVAYYAPFEQAAVVYTGAAERARALVEDIRHSLPAGEIWTQEINPVLGAHIGPGVLGFACVSARAAD